MPFQPVEPAADQRYRSCIPLIPLSAAAGGFGEPAEDLQAEQQWVSPRTTRRLGEGMFVAQVHGQSMQPRIPDGAYCLFAGPVRGSREGKIVLVRLRDQTDPETGERFTVKRYTSEKARDPDGSWHHRTITLHPLNPDYPPLQLAAEEADRLDVIAEFLEVLG